MMFSENDTWKSRLFRFLVYAAVAFAGAFLYKYLRK